MQQHDWKLLHCIVAYQSIKTEYSTNMSGVGNCLCVFTDGNDCDSPIDESLSQLTAHVGSRSVYYLYDSVDGISGCGVMNVPQHS